MLHWFALIGATFGALLPITNPFSTAPVFASLTQDMSEGVRSQVARMATIYAGSVLIGALLVGAIALEFFGISIPALRLAGGIIVAKVGFGMVNPIPEQRLSEKGAEEAKHKSDIAFTPIAMPLLSGPGSIAVTITMATEVERLWEYLAVGIGIVLVVLVAWVVLRSSIRVTRFLGATGMNVLTRLMGFVLVCIGVQFIVFALVEAVAAPVVVETIKNAYGS